MTTDRLDRIQQREAARWENQSTTWAEGLTAPFPLAWATRLCDGWRRQRVAVGDTAANLQHLQRVRQIERANRAGLPADAGDGQICTIAAESARDMARRLGQRDTITRGAIEPAESPWVQDWTERASLLAAYSEAAWWMDQLGLGDVLARMRGRLAGILARLTCERWWRRILRRLHAQAVEGTARALGLVHKRAGCYVSDAGLSRRQGQNRRNERALQSVEAVNELGQRFTLADLAAKGPANREIRRHELMTRIAGFELIAKEAGHVAYFVTVTCPSRMHAWRTRPGSSWATQANPKHDGTTPDAAQQHLSKQWARMRAAGDRLGLGLYGFRIAEPNHDGTPHWHMLFFMPAATGSGRQSGRVLVRLLRRYFYWQCDPGERGARHHRVKVEAIDWKRGTAAGYIAKYVAKNIDGYAIEKDLYGNEAITASARVDAWASTWHIRQFQQVGGAPVGVWRELRRLHPEQQQSGDGLALAIEAVNVAARGADAETDAVRQYSAAHAWATYTELQGGTRVRRRSLRFKVLREQSGACGRYGDVTPAAAVGVTLCEWMTERRAAFGIVPASTVRRQIVAQVESERADWVIVSRGGVLPECSGQLSRRRPTGAAGTGDAPPVGIERAARSAAPWSPVNNCTGALDAAHALRLAGALDVAPDRLFVPAVVRWPKLRRWKEWKAGPGGHDQERQTCP